MCKDKLYICDGQIPTCSKTTCAYISGDFITGCYLTKDASHGLREYPDGYKENDVIIIAIDRNDAEWFENIIHEECERLNRLLQTDCNAYERVILNRRLYTCNSILNQVKFV